MSDIVLTSFSCMLFMLAPENNQKLKNIFSSFFTKFRKGIVFSTFWSQKSISEKLFSKHYKWTAAVLHIKSASKDLEKNVFFVIKMASESHFKTIQQLTCFVMKNRVKSISFTSDIVLKGFSCVLFMLAPENNQKLKNIFSSFFTKFRKGIVFSTFWHQKSISEKLFS
jgi:mannitol/fructose-specific phosphotransferase system IIA component (Ntr-type)